MLPKICSIPECERTRYCKGWCKIHYRRVRATGSPGPVGEYPTKHNVQCSAQGCANSIGAQGSRGWCSAHYQMWKATGDPLGSTARSKSELFWEKVNKTSTCWEWTASLTSTGYGQFNFNGKPRKAHRIAYEFSAGPIHDGIFIDHMCHNTICVNPAHLRLATPKENAENRYATNPNNRSSGIRGVTWDESRRKWHASVGHFGRGYFAGRFSTVAEAEAAVVKKRLELHTYNLLDRIPA